MKIDFRIRHSLPLVLVVGLALAGRVTAQPFRVLHNFTPTYGTEGNYGTNNDGAYPQSVLVLSSNTLYGTARAGGDSGSGTVFAVNTDGTGFRTLHSFSTASIPYRTNTDGAFPCTGLILSGTELYGTTAGGGLGSGTVFKLNTEGTDFTSLYSFSTTLTNNSGVYTNDDGAGPEGVLLVSSNTLYGAAAGGGSSGNGTVFRLNTDGTDFSNLHSFAATQAGTNSDGAGPLAGLALSAGTLHGTAYVGGSAGNGTVFTVNTDGSVFSNLYNFSALDPVSFTNADGARPVGPLVTSVNSVYGTAAGGGLRSGIVFKLNADGTGFTNLHTFTATSSSYPYTNSDGADPEAGLILSGNTLYGTAYSGGTWGNGTVFKLNADGTGFLTLHSFTGSDGANPLAGLVLRGNTLYGTTGSGGSWGRGTVFSLSFSPQLTITNSGPNVILMWPTSYAGFDYAGYKLQSTTNLSSAVWTTHSSAPVVVNGQNTVTNPISGTQQFFRLSQ